ncbi:MAG: MBOAT family protein, partial [Polyangiaceae bacterium]|nr:MBOAT family protein [Polyangiaceae bacterium]
MLFNSPEFALFLVAVLLLYWALRHRVQARLWVLLVASYYFYACWDVRFLLLLFGITLVDWALALALSRARPGAWRAVACAAGIGLNLGLLGFWKYTDFVLDNLRVPLASLGVRVPASLGLVLPVGVSFFTFQGISYLVDVYRGDVAAERSLFRFALYKAFFPQLVAGPIVRARDIVAQFAAPFRLSGRDFGAALELVLGGLVKKVVLADFLAANLVDRVFDFPERFSSLEVAAAVYGYGLQIYGDFSGYTDIAIGVARLFGFELRPNFRLPYQADGLQDFWRRWHISLSSWLRDYLYVPLGGSRHGSLRTVAALLATMLLGGLWHGARWSFVWWGALHGVGLALERVWRQARGERRLVPRPVRVLLTLHFVLGAWVLFRCQDLGAAGAVFGRILAFEPGVRNLPFAVVGLLALGWVACFLPERWRVRTADLFARAPAVAQAAAVVGVLYLLRHFAGSAPAPFIYFQF